MKVILTFDEYDEDEVKECLESVTENTSLDEVTCYGTHAERDRSADERDYEAEREEARFKEGWKSYAGQGA
jgi:hypothetical protein